VALFFSSCSQSPACQTKELDRGIASQYAAQFQGKKTASGEIFEPSKLTAAHKTLEFGSRVKVTHLGNKSSVIVHINDRGPFVKGRVIDLSAAAAKKIGLSKRKGVAKVLIESTCDTIE
jgi:rare lipoprotein A